MGGQVGAVHGTGIGGVHRGGESSMDISADLAEIGRLGSPHRIRALEAGDTMRLVVEPTRAYG